MATCAPPHHRPVVCRRRYFIRPAAVSARVMTAPTSMPRRFGGAAGAGSGRTASECRHAATALCVRSGALVGGWFTAGFLPASLAVSLAFPWKLPSRLPWQPVNPFGEAEEIRDVIGRRNSRFDQERALRAIALVIVTDPERRAVGHIGDGVGFDDGFAIRIPPDLAGIAVDIGLGHRRRRQLMHVEPLLDDLVGIGGIDGAVGAAMPDRQFRPRALVAVRRCAPDRPVRRPGGMATGTCRSALPACWWQRRTAGRR